MTTPVHQPRIENPHKAAPEAIKAMMALEAALQKSGLEHGLLDLVKAQFSEAEQVNLTLLIGAINVWNRLQVGFRAAHPVDARDAA